MNDELSKQIQRLQQQMETTRRLTQQEWVKRIQDLVPTNPLGEFSGFKLTSPLLEQSQLLRDIRPDLLPMEHLHDAIRQASDSLRSNTERLQEAFKPMQQFHQHLADVARAVVRPYLEVIKATEQLSQQLRAAFEPTRQIRDAVSDFSSRLQTEFQKALEAHAEQFRDQWDETERHVFALFAKLGLAGLENYLTRSELLYIWHLSKEEGNKAVQLYIFRKFRKSGFRLLNRAVRTWWRVPYMSKRKKQIRSAISAHKAGQYELAIPALLPLIDGLAAIIVAGFSITKKKIIHAKEAAAIYHQREGEAWSECVEHVVTTLIYRNYEFKPGKKPPSSVNRHGILHGRIIGYASELNSYRVILLLDVMTKIADPGK